jgi:hypothetical protein
LPTRSDCSSVLPIPLQTSVEKLQVLVVVVWESGSERSASKPKRLFHTVRLRRVCTRCRTSKPGLKPRDLVETVNRFEEAPAAQPQHARIIRSNGDGISNSHPARKLELARSDGWPVAAWGTPVQRIAAYNGERSAASILREPSDGQVRNLLPAAFATDCKQPVALCCDKYRCSYHGLRSFPATGY